MKPERLSATALETFEQCEVRYRAERLDRVPSIQSSAAGFGTVFHTVAERWVADGHYATGADFDVFRDLLDTAWHEVFSTKDRWDEMIEMCENWYNNQDWVGREVISTELQETFQITVDGVTIPVMYIFDRADDISGGLRKKIEVIDYKTWMRPMQPEEMKGKIQVRLYGLAAQIKWPEAEEIWVSLDQTRYQPVGVLLSREDNAETWHYLHAVARRILASEGDKESLNENCGWCVRKHTCETATKNIEGGGVLNLDADIDATIEYRAMLKNKSKLLYDLLQEADSHIMEWAERMEIEGAYSTANVDVKIKTKATRTADAERVSKVLGPEVVARYASLGITTIDKILKQEELDDAQRSQIKQLIRKKKGAPYIETKAKTALSPKE